ncbi:MAG: 50S ribosomal protein L9 [Deltaproteobacteria bacterium]|nr:50S ribosomal protein L9 [Deltaproteobacteria bacterium]
MMQIILREDVPNLGVVGELVAVRDGYARNFLIPQGKAVFASVRSIRELEHQKRLAAHRRLQATTQAQSDKQRIEGLSICLQAKVAQALGEEAEVAPTTLQKLFGSIGARDIARVLGDLGVKADHRRVTLSEPVRTVGKFAAQVRLEGGVVAKLPFWVITEGATDIEAEKRRVEAAQEAARKQRASELEAEAKAKAQARQEAAAKAEAAAQAAASGDSESAVGSDVEESEETSAKKSKGKKGAKK